MINFPTKPAGSVVRNATHDVSGIAALGKLAVPVLLPLHVTWIMMYSEQTQVRFV